MTFRVIVIDPEARTIRDFRTILTLDNIRALVRAPGSLDHCVIADHPTSFDQCWLDGMGLARGEPIHAFRFKNREDPMAGCCVIIGFNKETGGDDDARMPLDFVLDQVVWLGLIKPEVTTVDEGGGSVRLVVTYARAGL